MANLSGLTDNKDASFFSIFADINEMTINYSYFHGSIEYSELANPALRKEYLIN